MPSRTITHEPGIYECLGDRRKNRFLWRQVIRGKPYRMAFDSLEKARAAKASKLAQIEKYGNLAIQFDERDIAALVRAREILPKGVSIERAAEFYVSRHGGGGRTIVEDGVGQFLAYQEKIGNSPKYIANLRSSLLKLSAEFGDLEVSAITRSMVMGILDELAGRVSSRTVGNARTAFSNFFAYFVDMGEISESPVSRITKRHLPRVKSVTRKHPLEAAQVARIMELCESEFSQYALWMALQFFVGFREAEASRFRHEWIQSDLGRIHIPGWFYERGELKQGTKTQDDWMIDKVPANFWKWHGKYGEPSGEVAHPSNSKQWRRKIRNPIIEAGILERWPHNAKRDSFCTYHISAYRDPQATALILKHRNVNTLWQSYMGCLRPERDGEAFFAIEPAL